MKTNRRVQLNKELEVVEKRNALLVQSSDKEKELASKLTVFTGGSTDGHITSISLENAVNKFSPEVEKQIEKEKAKQAIPKKDRKSQGNVIVGVQRVAELAELKNIRNGDILVANKKTDKYTIFYEMRALMEGYSKNPLLFKISLDTRLIIDVLDNTRYIDVVLPLSDLIAVVYPKKGASTRLSNSYNGAYFINCKPRTNRKNTIIDGIKPRNMFDPFMDNNIQEKNRLDNRVISSMPLPTTDDPIYLKRTDLSILYDDVIIIIITKPTIAIWEVYPFGFKDLIDNALETFTNQIELNSAQDKADAKAKEKAAKMRSTSTSLVVGGEPSEIFFNSDSGITDETPKKKKKATVDMSYVELVQEILKDLGKDKRKIQEQIFNKIVKLTKDMSIVNPSVLYPMDQYISINIVNSMLQYFNDNVMDNDECYSEFYRLYKGCLEPVYDLYVDRLSIVKNRYHDKYPLLKERWKRIVPDITLRLLFHNSFSYCNGLIDRDRGDEETSIDL